MRSTLVFVALIGCLPLQSCVSGSRRQPIQSAPEWVSLSAGVLDRSTEGVDILDDSPGAMLQGGYAFSRGSLRPSFEMGFGASRHDVAPATPDDPSRVELYRALGGVRLEYDLEQRATTVWGQAGMFYRWTNESSFEAAAQDQDGDGFYAGGGIFFWWDRDSAVGPFVTHFRDREDDHSETYFGFQVVLRHSGSIAARRSSY